MKRVGLFLTIIAMVLSLSALAFAHSGKTDSKGGHINHSTGEYHYHHGYPEHQHYNGTCPYDFDDQTGRNSGTSSGSKAQSSKASSNISTKDDDLEPAWWTVILLSGVIGWFFGYPAGMILTIIWSLMAKFFKFDPYLLPENFFCVIGFLFPIICAILIILQRI